MTLLTFLAPARLPLQTQTHHPLLSKQHYSPLPFPNKQSSSPPPTRRARYFCKFGSGNGLFGLGGSSKNNNNFDKSDGSSRNEGFSSSGKGNNNNEGAEEGGEEEEWEEEAGELDIGNGETWGIKYSFRRKKGDVEGREGGSEGEDEEEEEEGESEEDEEGDEEDGSEVEEVIEEEVKFAGSEKAENALGELIGQASASNSGEDNEIFKAVGQYSIDRMDDLQKKVSEDAQEAMKRTMMGMFGSLPTMAYDVQITTDKEGVSKVMLASLSNGYLLRNAEVRMLLNDSLQGMMFGASNNTKSATQQNIEADKESKSADGKSKDKKNDSEPDYMKNVPNRNAVKRSAITGKVEWWDAQTQKKAHMEAGDYIGKLESEVDLLRSRLDAKKALSNRLLEFISTISPEKLAQLQSGLSTKALGAMKTVIRRTLGVVPSVNIQQNYLGGRDYFAHLALWSMMVGYVMRDTENKIGIERIFAEDDKSSDDKSSGDQGSSKSESGEQAT